MNTKRIENYFSVEYDLETGRAWLEHRETGFVLFQCCLAKSKTGPFLYKKVIKYYGCGWDDGFCGDFNFSLYSRESAIIVKEVFFSFARKAGIKVI